ncbi:hypothetical protein NMG60_11012883 [Bertholletia excelsa]
MDYLKPTSAPTMTKLSRTFHKVLHVRAATKTLSSKHEMQRFEKERNRAAMESFVAKLFAAVSAVKAAYSELQMAQFPYDGEAIQAADEAVVGELKSLSELKQSFLKKQLDLSPPHVVMLLAEIQEQQSLIKIYSIALKKMRAELETKDTLISSLREELNDVVVNNKSLEKRLNSSEQFSDFNLNSFNLAMEYALRSVRCFVKLMIREMKAANWDIEAATAAIEPEVKFRKANHSCFALESFVCKEMFEDFNSHDSPPSDGKARLVFRKLKAANPVQFLKKNPNSAFGKFTRARYLNLIHLKMEASFFGNLDQRKLISSGEFPASEFFAAFAEMAKRVWVLHCLASSFNGEMTTFQVGRGCRFSEVYMESVTDDVFQAAADGSSRVAFTVVPGIKVGKTVIQSQVYLFPVVAPAES